MPRGGRGDAGLGKGGGCRTPAEGGDTEMPPISQRPRDVSGCPLSCPEAGPRGGGAQGVLSAPRLCPGRLLQPLPTAASPTKRSRSQIPSGSLPGSTAPRTWPPLRRRGRARAAGSGPGTQPGHCHRQPGTPPRDPSPACRPETPGPGHQDPGKPSETPSPGGGGLVPPRVSGAGAAPSCGSWFLVAPFLAVIPNLGWVDSGSSHVADVPPAPCSSCGDTDGGSPLATGHSCSPWVPAGGHCSVSVPPEPSPPWPTLQLLPGTSPGCPKSPCSHPSCGRCWGELRAEQTPGGGGTP